MVSLCPITTVSLSKIPSHTTGYGQGPFHALAAFVCLWLLTSPVAQILLSSWIHPRAQRRSLGPGWVIAELVSPIRQTYWSREEGVAWPWARGAGAVCRCWPGLADSNTCCPRMAQLSYTAVFYCLQDIWSFILYLVMNFLLSLVVTNWTLGIRGRSRYPIDVRVSLFIPA